MARAREASRRLREKFAGWLLEGVHLRDVHFGEHTVRVAPKNFPNRISIENSGGAGGDYISDAQLSIDAATTVNIGGATASQVNLGKAGGAVTEILGQAVIKAKAFGAGTADLVMANNTVLGQENVLGTGYALTISTTPGNVSLFNNPGFIQFEAFQVQLLTSQLYLAGTTLMEWGGTSPVTLLPSGNTAHTTVTLQPLGSGTPDVTFPQVRFNDLVEAVVSTTNATPTPMLPGNGYVIINDHSYIMRLSWNARNTGGGLGNLNDSMSGWAMYNAAVDNSQGGGVVAQFICGASGGDASVAAATVTIAGVGGTNVQMTATGVAGTNIAFEAWMDIIQN